MKVEVDRGKNGKREGRKSSFHRTVAEPCSVAETIKVSGSYDEIEVMKHTIRDLFLIHHPHPHLRSSSFPLLSLPNRRQ